jgi:hypothetical protein
VHLDTDDLIAQFNRDGFDVNRSSVYLQLKPKRFNSSEGNGISSATYTYQNDHYKSHPDQRFCKATINNLEQLALLLGPSEGIFLSQDDNARYCLRNINETTLFSSFIIIYILRYIEWILELLHQISKS